VFFFNKEKKEIAFTFTAGSVSLTIHTFIKIARNRNELYFCRYYVPGKEYPNS